MTKLDRSALREGGRVTSQTLTVLADAVAPGVTTQELDQLAHDTITSEGAIPAFLGMYGFPGSVCISINEEVVHGIPRDRKLEAGDIVTLDLGAKVNGWFTDSALTVPVGPLENLEPETRHLLEVTWNALYLGIDQARPAHTTGDLGFAVQKAVEEAGFNVVRDCTGHGIGQKLHQDPSLPNFGKPGSGKEFEENLVLAIEPMVVTGSHEVRTLSDNWTVATRDRGLAAHYEETVIVTGGEPERITPLPDVLQARKSGDRLGKVSGVMPERSDMKDPQHG